MIPWAVVHRAAVIHAWHRDVLHVIPVSVMACHGIVCSERWSIRWCGVLEQLLPPLITTSPTGTAVANAGVLGQASTSTLVGGRYRSEMTSGGRAQLGIWMDEAHCNSVLLRFWASGRESMNFFADQTDGAFVAVPFNNAADNATPTALLVVEPQQAQGSINIQTRSELYGGDALLRRLCRTGLGGRVDAFWGYQTARINEDLTIAIDTVGLDGGNREGQRLQINDIFDAKNEFHGGTFGYEGFYREGCWSWHLLTKLGLGSMQRTATIRGTTTRTSGGISAIDDQGFFARDTNIGVHSSSEFSVAPEINLTLGYIHRPGMDFTFGYNYQLYTNAIQPAQLIDTTTTDLNDPAITRPRVILRDKDYYVHSLNFGFNWHY
ncbi:MAG: BBP7 family outer membrane beta-barrel protein [Pirellulaceae bacterium]